MTFKWQDLVKDGEFNILPDLWIALNAALSQDEIIELLQDAVDVGGLQFPLRDISLVQAIDDFRKLRFLDTSTLIESRAWTTNFDYSYGFQDKTIGKDNTGLLSSDYFHQRSRYGCDDVRRMSALRSWTNRKFRRGLFKSLWTMERTQVTSREIRAAGALRKYVAAQFRPSAAKAVYDLFGGGRVLDFSAGWGDRLSAALASNCVTRYVGIDPNPRLQQGYLGQIETYNRNLDGDLLDMFEVSYTPKDVKVITSPAEDTTIEGDFDLVFTSPPYFDKERYSKDPTQSWVRYKTPGIWLSRFLFPVLEKVWDRLVTGGHLCVNVTDVRVFDGGPVGRIRICDPMNDHMKTLPGAEYKGAMGMDILVRANLMERWEAFCEPLWIWQKT